MNITKGVIMIPNELVLNAPTYMKIGKNIYHAEIYREFSVFYFDQLYDKFELLDKDFIILEIVDDEIYIYVPATITEKQYEELKKYKKALAKASFIVFSIDNVSGYDDVSSTDFPDVSSCLEYFYKKVGEKCLKRGGRK